MSAHIAAVDTSDVHTKFILSGVSSHVVNVVRHALFADVPVLAADVVGVDQYNGVLDIEVVNLRLGQLPIRPTDPHDMFTPIEFTINVETDPAVPRLTWVCSKDVVCPSGRAQVVHYRSDHEASLATKDRGHPICPLHQGQKLALRFVTKRGTGREGTRWNSVRPAVLPTPDGAEITVETTGACTPREAMKAALQSIRTRLVYYTSSTS